MTSRAKYCLFTLVAKVTSHGRILVRFCASDLQNMLDNRGCGQLHNTIHGTSHALAIPELCELFVECLSRSTADGVVDEMSHLSWTTSSASLLKALTEQKM